MRRAMAVGLCLAVLAPSVRAAEPPRLVDPPLRLDDGSGGRVGNVVLEGCASVGTEVVASVGLSALLLGGANAASALFDRSSENTRRARGMVVVAASQLVAPFAASALVDAIASRDGASPRYWKTLLAGLAAEVVFGALYLVSERPAVAYLGHFTAAALEAWAANAGRP